MVQPGEVCRSISSVDPPAPQVGLLGQLALGRLLAAAPPARRPGPAGSSHSRRPTGCRYCRTSTTRPVVVERDHPDRADVARRSRGRPRRRRAWSTSSVTHVEDRPVVHRGSAGDRPVSAPVLRRRPPAPPATVTRRSAPASTGELVGLRVRQRGADERGEQRVRPGRPALELRVRLGGHEERVHARAASSTNSTSRPSGEVPEIRSPALVERVPVGVVDLVPVPVPLGRPRSTRTPRPRSSPRPAAPGTSPAASCRPGRPCRRRCPPGRPWWRSPGGGAGSSNSSELAPVQAGQVTRRPRSSCTAGRGRARGVGIPFSRAYRTAPILPSMPRTPKPPGMHDPVHAGERRRGAGRGDRSRRWAPSGAPPGRGGRSRRPGPPR